MADTVNQIVAEAQKVARSLTSARGIELVNQVHSILLSEIPHLKRGSVNISLVIGQQDYDLDENILQVDAVYVGTIQLSETTIEDLNKKAKGWRGAANEAVSEGTQYFLSSVVGSGDVISKNQIGLYKKPTATGTMTVHGSLRQTGALIGTNQIPAVVPHSRAYIEGTTWLAARELFPQASAAYYQLFLSEMDRLKRYIETKNELLKDNKPFRNIRMEP